jgi:threonine dehydratase
MTLPVRFEDVLAASRGLAGRIRHTPLLPFGALSEKVGIPVFLKAESLQRGGAFKIRGALNAVAAALARGERPKGVITYSSGNHAQGVAIAAKTFGLPSIVVMPTDAPRVKEAATIAYGAEVTRVGLTSEDRRVVAERIAAEKGFLMVRPFDDPDVVAGQGTVALEILHDLPQTEAILVPCGGGGLTAGVALAATETRRSIAVYSVEAEAAPKMARSLAAGAIVASPPGPSIADGLRPNAPGEIPFAIARERLAGALTVGEAELEEAVELLLSRARLVVEPSGAAGVAALWSGKLRPARGPVVVVLSGGNIDPTVLARVVKRIATS